MALSCFVALPPFSDTTKHHRNGVALRLLQATRRPKVDIDPTGTLQSKASSAMAGHSKYSKHSKPHLKYSKIHKESKNRRGSGRANEGTENSACRAFAHLWFLRCRFGNQCSCSFSFGQSWKSQKDCKGHSNLSTSPNLSGSQLPGTCKPETNIWTLLSHLQQSAQVASGTSHAFPIWLAKVRKVSRQDLISSGPCWGWKLSNHGWSCHVLPSVKGEVPCRCRTWSYTSLCELFARNPNYAI